MNEAVATTALASGAAKNRWAWLNIWTVGTILIAVMAIAPICAVIFLSLTPSDDIWSHLVDTVLPDYISTTLLLMVSVAIGTLLIGVGSAWIVSMCRFPGKKIFEWALLLPMAMPAYVIAYVYTDILEYAGPVQGMLREIFGWETKREYWFPEIRSLGGAASMMTLVLYPYVYLLSRAAFLEQSVCVLEASRVLGRGPWRSFFSVALPLARPAIVIGLSLVMMETLNDFGTVDFFAVNTFTLGIYDVWLNMNNIAGAAQLSCMLLFFVMFLIAAERFGRRKQKFHHTTSKYKALPGYELPAKMAILATIGCALPIVLGFVLPAVVLFYYAIIHFDMAATQEVLGHAGNSALLSVVAAIFAIAIGTFMAYGVRLRKEKTLKFMVRFASLGYAVPGSVLAVGVLVTLGGLDNGIDGYMRENFGISTGLIFSGTIAAVTYGYLVRFLALSFGSVESSLGKVTPSMDGASRSLGHGAFATLRKIHIPIIRGSMLTAVMMVFVDCMKELPITVILRPFNFHTLATYVHQFASDEQLGEASLAALAIVGFGIFPVIILSIAINKSRPGHN
ncbi:Binding-protein-dependent transport system inner membrane protein [Candidatus Terasakiella magnetica]|uniref:Binding-protein-dependent transport system inner membrane protein n=1 Tax=Candidatus Terasakiella magnetica TaxID=1867952 RepID=A0A1C3RFW1_9PROT|nr:iron ABC transporter permease [Candidatus Terasakiella magnetica]SCA56145.1 Binding-protein-dependent transport system inner membrane protein [Candidatus Terasakiella magnetica]